LMACVRSFTPASLGAQPRRRRRGNQVRRDIGVLPAEADEVLEASSRAGLTVSAFLRQALEKHLPG
jgi:signal recognition particle subunit SEC65